MSPGILRSTVLTIVVLLALGALVLGFAARVGLAQDGNPTAPAETSTPAGSAPAAGSPFGRLEGTARRAPTCAGPGRPGEVCEAPMQATINILDEGGSTVAHFASDANGSFSILLPPGAYTIAPERDTTVAGGAIRVTPPIVTIADGAVVQVAIEYDTGIR